MKKAKCGCDLFFAKEFNYHDNGCKLVSQVIVHTGKSVTEVKTIKSK